jgi:cation diffusion facilitator family transporter
MFGGKRGASRLSVIVVVGLVLIKVAVGIWTGSLSVLAQAIDSFLDLFAVIVTMVAIGIASRPADKEHPFGHGKAENIAAIIQAVLIFIAAGSIIYSAVDRALAGTAPDTTEAGIAVMAVSAAASIFLARCLRRVSREEDSPALAATADNIRADVYSALAVLAGLIAVRITGLGIIDSILGGIVALFILKVGFDVVRNSFGSLVDVKLPENEEKAIRDVINEHKGVEIVGFHRLRTRKAGSHRYIDLHLVMPYNISIKKAHDIVDILEDDIGRKLGLSDVTIHVEPCDENCPDCDVTDCEDRKN